MLRLETSGVSMIIVGIIRFAKQELRHGPRHALATLTAPAVHPIMRREGPLEH
jgi:hypothetical protein